MKIIWFSEIKWSYLRTRKQHILSKFKNSDEILFVEPLSLNLKNKFNISIEKNVRYVTIPQIQNSDYKMINRLLNMTFIRKFLDKISNKMIKNFIKNDFEPNVIITSNVFWINFINKFIKEKKLKLIYDCNDNPLAFPNSFKKKKYFEKTLKVCDNIVVPHNSYKKFIDLKYHNKVTCIPNGVDKKLICSEKFHSNFLKNTKNIIMYVGSIDTRIDFKLIDNLSKDLIDYNFVFIGNVKKQCKNSFIKIIRNKNIFHIKSINYSQIGDCLKYAKKAIIPFEKNKLSKNILPNKIFEYSILGVPFIMTNFNAELKEMNLNFKVSNDYNEFKNFIIEKNKISSDINDLKEFAKNYEWQNISQQYQKFIKSIID